MHFIGVVLSRTVADDVSEYQTLYKCLCEKTIKEFETPYSLVSMSKKGHIKKENIHGYENIGGRNAAC